MPQSSSSRKTRAVLALMGFTVVTTVIASCNQIDDPQLLRSAPPQARRTAFSNPGRIIGVNVNDGYGYGTQVADLGVSWARAAILYANYDRWDTTHVHNVAASLAPAQVVANVAYLYDSFPVLQYPGSSSPWQHCGAVVTESTENACIPTGTPQSDGDAWDSVFTAWKLKIGHLIRGHAYADGITYWEVWNEPNSRSFFNGEVWQYDSLARAMCDTVHAVTDANPTRAPLTCVGPAMAFFSRDSSFSNQIGWLNARLTNDHFDIASVHVYEPEPRFTSVVDSIRAAINKPLWVTETGPIYGLIGPGALDPELYDKGVIDRVNAFSSNADTAAAIFFYNLISSDAGLIDSPSGTARPAYYGLKHRLAGTLTYPAAGYCSTAGSPAPCNFGATAAATPPVMAGMPASDLTTLTVKVVNFANEPQPGVTVVWYLSSTALFGQKTTDNNGTVVFRTYSHSLANPSVLQRNAVMGWSADPNYVWAYNDAEQHVEAIDTGFTATPSAPGVRTLVVSKASRSECQIIAHVRDSAHPSTGVAGVPVDAAYTGAFNSYHLYTNSNGDVTFPTIDCTVPWALSIWGGYSDFPSGWHVNPMPGNFASVGNIFFYVHQNSGNTPPTIYRSQERTLYVTRN